MSISAKVYYIDYMDQYYVDVNGTDNKTKTYCIDELIDMATESLDNTNNAMDYLSEHSTNTFEFFRLNEYEIPEMITDAIFNSAAYQMLANDIKSIEYSDEEDIELAEEYENSAQYEISKMDRKIFTQYF